MLWRLTIVALLLCTILTPVVPAYAAPLASPGPEDAVPLTGIQSGALEPGKDRWFTFWDRGSEKPLGLALNYDPAPPVEDPQVTFVVWAYIKQGLDAKLAQIGKGTGVGLSPGVKYWRGGSNVARTYYVQVVNSSSSSVDYAIALTGDVYPPPGLGGNDTAAREILAKAIASQKDIKTAQTEVEMALSLDATSGRESVKLGIAMTGKASIDYPNKRMKMNMKMSMSSPQSPVDLPMDIQMEMYVLGEWMYMKMVSAGGMPGMDQQWVKAPADEKMWDSWTSQNTMFAREAARVRLAGTDTVDGIACYVLDIKPGKDVVQSLLAQPPAGGAGDIFSEVGLEDLFDAMSLKVWVAKETYFVTKQELTWPIKLIGDEARAIGLGMDSLEMHLSYRMKMSGLNQPVSIQLPPEASGAMEAPGVMAPGRSGRPSR